MNMLKYIKMSLLLFISIAQADSNMATKTSLTVNKEYHQNLYNCFRGFGNEILSEYNEYTSVMINDLLVSKSSNEVRKMNCKKNSDYCSCLNIVTLNTNSPIKHPSINPSEEFTCAQITKQSLNDSISKFARNYSKENTNTDISPSYIVSENIPGMLNGVSLIEKQQKIKMLQKDLESCKKIKHKRLGQIAIAESNRLNVLNTQFDNIIKNFKIACNQNNK